MMELEPLPAQSGVNGLDYAWSHSLREEVETHGSYWDHHDKRREISDALSRNAEASTEPPREEKWAKRLRLRLEKLNGDPDDADDATTPKISLEDVAREAIDGEPIPRSRRVKITSPRSAIACLVTGTNPDDLVPRVPTPSTGTYPESAYDDQALLRAEKRKRHANATRLTALLDKRDAMTREDVVRYLAELADARRAAEAAEAEEARKREAEMEEARRLAEEAAERERNKRLPIVEAAYPTPAPEPEEEEEHDYDHYDRDDDAGGRPGDDFEDDDDSDAASEFDAYAEDYERALKAKREAYAANHAEERKRTARRLAELTRKELYPPDGDGGGENQFPNRGGGGGGDDAGANGTTRANSFRGPKRLIVDTKIGARVNLGGSAAFAAPTVRFNPPPGAKKRGRVKRKGKKKSDPLDAPMSTMEKLKILERLVDEKNAAEAKKQRRENRARMDRAGELAEEKSRLDDAARARKVRSISHWSPYDRVGVVNADP